METIEIMVEQGDVYEEVAKATDYTGSKMIEGDPGARDRILAGDEDLTTLERMWEETVMAANENFKEMLVSGRTVKDENGEKTYELELEVSRAFDKGLRGSVESLMRSYFIASIIGQWFKYANKAESASYITQAADILLGAERMLYSRKKPRRPED